MGSDYETICENFKEDLSAHFDGELDAERATLVDSHLKECEPCRNAFNKLGGLSKFLAVGRKSEEVPDIWQAISGTIDTSDHISEEDLSAYLDSELPPATLEGVREHLDSCSPCSGKQSELKAVSGLIHDALILPQDMDINIWPELRSRLNEDCALIQSELSAFLDQEVATLRHRNVVGHLMQCPTCKDLFDELDSVGNIIRTNYRPDIPEDFDLWPEIKAKLQVVPFAARPKQPAKVIPFKRRAYAIAAAIVALGLVAALVTRQQQGYSHLTAEAYMIDSALEDQGDNPDQFVYEN
ncbi:MAG: zf-HC2 domain-containing protein [Candidatus Obscuribacterales bacterium]|nr:zf-HC2 domain-containing protein [Candidatus Obscuribacterales bacterium]